MIPGIDTRTFIDSYNSLVFSFIYFDSVLLLFYEATKLDLAKT
jgi:hypothetical protein